MSVYIKSMTIPPEGEYRMTLYVCQDGSAYIDVASFPVDEDRFDAISVPDHGDLIDRDALPENRMVFDRVKFINERFIKDAPVIIPADTCEEYEDKDGYRDERNR